MTLTSWCVQAVNSKTSSADSIYEQEHTGWRYAREKNEEDDEQNDQYRGRHHNKRRETGRKDQLQVLGSIPVKVSHQYC
ncbi:hypothetical protein DPMN_189155 [Dreissena polymorpha]|uniref:Uncharacterized protein n=1 Tax=Dreissena polymorpha TaxID=45954 RepID=A0A9D4IAK5_DREPO|nr:hypothetical protein DPMN_189155 [Dreissena polymorpha]